MKRDGRGMLFNHTKPECLKETLRWTDNVYVSASVKVDYVKTLFF